MKLKYKNISILIVFILLIIGSLCYILVYKKTSTVKNTTKTIKTVPDKKIYSKIMSDKVKKPNKNKSAAVFYKEYFENHFKKEILDLKDQEFVKLVWKDTDNKLCIKEYEYYDKKEKGELGWFSKAITKWYLEENLTDDFINNCISSLSSELQEKLSFESLINGYFENLFKYIFEIYEDQSFIKNNIDALEYFIILKTKRMATKKLSSNNPEVAELNETLIVVSKYLAFYTCLKTATYLDRNNYNEIFNIMNSGKNFNESYFINEKTLTAYIQVYLIPTRFIIMSKEDTFGKKSETLFELFNKENNLQEIQKTVQFILMKNNSSYLTYNQPKQNTMKILHNKIEEEFLQKHSEISKNNFDDIVPEFISIFKLINDVCYEMFKINNFVEAKKNLVYKYAKNNNEIKIDLYEAHSILANETSLI